jgi:hypothetical protein
MMRHTFIRLRVVMGICFALPLVLAFPAPAHAAWVAAGTGTSSGLAYTMPSGAQPIASVRGSSVILRWPTALFPDNQAVAGYDIRRFNAVTGSPATVGANCSGTVTTTTCTEMNVSSGTWTYTDSTVQDNWNGNQSAPSAAVTVP